MTTETPPNWEVELQRITIFRFPGTELDVSSLWKFVSKFEADEIVNKPAIGFIRYEGQYENGRLILSVDNQRLDLIITAQPMKDVIDISTIGALDQVLIKFNETADKLLTQLDGVLRVAYGLIVVERTKDKMSSYKRLSELLPSIQIDVENSSDFFFQINRPVKSEILENNLINRISRWSAVQLLHAVVTNESTGVQVMKPTNLEATRIELDISTPADRTEQIPKDSFNRLLKELSTIAKDIALHGDK